MPSITKSVSTSATGGAVKPAVAMITVDEDHAGQRLDNFLIARLKGVPKSHIYRIVRGGEVRVNKGRVDVSHRLAEGEVVRIPPIRLATSGLETGAAPAHAAGMSRQDLPVLFEDDALLAIDKPAGLAVHGGSGVAFGVIEALRAQRPEAKFLELVHRLDRETSGVLLVAKKRSALTAMHALLRGDSAASSGAKAGIRKYYSALVKGDWPDEKRSVKIRLSKYLTASGERRVAVDPEDGRESHTVFTRVERIGKVATLLDCDIRTGRTHQIRVHLAHLGFPIAGDDKYGDFAWNKVIQAKSRGGLKRMFLHARQIAFDHPLTGDALVIESPLPADLARFLAFLRS
ncbi:MAG: RluA family pseudouridine synthase [Betaproteobacteria bacterium]|nr:RluA family pseudouridine synthase [Betaproteobacteria bacterium]